MDRRLLFNYYFGLKISDRIDPLLASIFAGVSTVFFIIILIVANLNYDQLALELQHKIKEKYKRYVSELIVSDADKARLATKDTKTQKDFIPIEQLPPKKSTRESRLKERAAIADRLVKDNAVFGKKSDKQGGGITALYEDLPDLDDIDLSYNDESFVELSRPVGNGGRFFGAPRKSASQYDPGELEAILTKPFSYQIARQGEVYIELTDELVKEENKEKTGYRDPEEIERVVYKHQDMIQHCFKKEARYQAGLSGYIKVQFSISPYGYVIPESIKILSSTLRNRQIEQCIKNYIKRWRGFSRLDESMGIATVVQKFVFN